MVGLCSHEEELNGGRPWAGPVDGNEDGDTDRGGWHLGRDARTSWRAGSAALLMLLVAAAGSGLGELQTQPRGRGGEVLRDRFREVSAMPDPARTRRAPRREAPAGRHAARRQRRRGRGGDQTFAVLAAGGVALVFFS